MPNSPVPIVPYSEILPPHHPSGTLLPQFFDPKLSEINNPPWSGDGSATGAQTGDPYMGGTKTPPPLPGPGGWGGGAGATGGSGKGGGTSGGGTGGSGGSGSGSGETAAGDKARAALAELLKAMLDNPFTKNLTGPQQILLWLMGQGLDGLTPDDASELEQTVDQILSLMQLADGLGWLFRFGGLGSGVIAALLEAMGFAGFAATAIAGSDAAAIVLAAIGVILVLVYLYRIGVIAWPKIKELANEVIDAFMQSFSNLSANVQVELRRALWFMMDPQGVMH